MNIEETRKITLSLIDTFKLASQVSLDLRKAGLIKEIKSNGFHKRLDNYIFNDKDFLKKVKDIHPTLTNNDLRLCAYLRLNLTSKDIAPLLNISLSSVEIKRYRLRKKMDLTRGDGLTDHLLSL